MAYSKTTWVNGGPPALSAENLNKMEEGIYNNADSIDTINTWIGGSSRLFTASWDAASTSAFGTKITGNLSLTKGLYIVVLTSPYVEGNNALVGLRTNGIIDNTRLVTLWNGTYTKAAFLVQMDSPGTLALYSEGSAATTYTAKERGSLAAIKVGGF